MSQSSGPEPERHTGHKSRWVRTSLTAGSVIVLAGAGAVLAGWIFVNERLSSLLESQLTEALERPVEIGELERLTLSKIRFGPSSLPPIESDPDAATFEAIEVRFNLLQLLGRELRLNVDLEQADIYVEQAADGSWIDIDIERPERDPDQEPFIEVKPGTIRLSNSEMTLLPYIPPATDIPEAERPEDQDQVTFADVNGRIQFSDADLEDGASDDLNIESQALTFEVEGESVRQGKLEVEGTALLPPDPDTLPEGAEPIGTEVKMTVRAQELRATDIMPVVRSFYQTLPVDVTTGLLSGNATLEYAPQEPFVITGTAQVSDAAVAVKGLPIPVEDISGQVRFQGRQIAFEDVSAELGELAAEAGGTLDFRNGYDFSGQMAPFTVAEVAELFDLELPVDTEGAFTADVTVTGPLRDPVVSADLVSEGVTTVDKVDFTRLEARAIYQNRAVTVEEFVAQPVAGGQLTGSGRYGFGRPGQLSLTATGSNLPADTIGRPYGLTRAFAIGPVSLEADLSGPVGDLQGIVNWRAPTGDYPARGRIRLAGDGVRFTDTVITVAGGTVTGSGSLVDGRWQADLQAQSIQLAQLTDNLEGTVAGSAQLTGSLDNANLQGIQGQGRLNIAVAGGSVNAQAALASGRWQADLQGDGLQLAQFSENLQGTAATQLTASGSLENLSLAGIQARGNLVVFDGLAAAAPLAPQLASVQEPLTASVAWNGSVLTVEQAQTAGIQASGTITPRLEGVEAPAIANVNLALQVDDYSLAALPTFSRIAPLEGSASFQGRLTGSPDSLTLTGDAQLANFAISDLEFESPLRGPVRVALNDGVEVDLQGAEQDTIQVSYGFDQRRLRFNVRADEALARGQTEGDRFQAEIENFPLAALNLPPGGVPGFGTVGGTVEDATVVADLSQPQVRAEFAIVNPGLGFLNIRGLPTIVDGVEQENLSRFEGVFTYANGTAALTQGELSTGSSLYLVNARYSPQATPELRGQISVEKGQIQDILTTLQFFELSDLGRGLRAPEWARKYSPEELQLILDTMAAGDPEASLLEQLQRIAEILELQDQAVASADTVLPSLSELQGEFSGDILFVGSLPTDIDVEFELAGNDWQWGSTYRADTVVAEGLYRDGILQLNPLRFASAPEDPESYFDISGAVAFRSEDTTPRTLSFDARNIPIAPLQQPLRIPADIAGSLNANATFSGPIANPQLRGSLEVESATINDNPLEDVGADFLYQDARFNLASSLVVEDPDDPLMLTASIPYRLPFARQVPASDQLLVDLYVRDEGLLLLNLLNQQVAIESGSGALELAVRGNWPDGQPAPDLASLDLTGQAQLEDVILNAQILPQPLTDINGSLRFRDDLIIVERLRGNYSDGELLAQGTFPILVPLALRADATEVRTSQRKQADQAAPETVPLDEDTDASELRQPDPDQIPADIAQLPLVLDLSKIALNFKGIYNGQVDGRVQLGGSALLYGPALSGSVVLSNGRLSLPESGIANGGGVNDSGTDLVAADNSGPPVRFDDFTLFLNQGTRIQVGGIVDVAARGSIVTNGIFPDIQPRGRVELPSGRVNLLTTEFRLRGNDNFAEFRPALGLEPYLKATLQAAVPDSTGAGATSLTTASPFPRNEISDANTDQLGLNRSGIETVRIRAEVEGPAFQVAQLRGVSLRSTPVRSEGEIISLISGGVLTALESTLGSVGGEGDNFEGLIALAGSTVLNQIQGFLGDALNIGELRLYSATPESAQGSGSSIDIGAEIGFEISPDISLSVQKTFTDITPFQFNVRYRINNQFTLRGTTSYEDFTENSGLLLEYETRF